MNVLNCKPDWLNNIGGTVIVIAEYKVISGTKAYIASLKNDIEQKESKKSNLKENKAKFENELKEFFDEMEKDNILENYFLMMNYIFGKLYYSKQGAHFKHNTIKKANNKILSLKK